MQRPAKHNSSQLNKGYNILDYIIMQCNKYSPEKHAVTSAKQTKKLPHVEASSKKQLIKIEKNEIRSLRTSSLF